MQTEPQSLYPIRPQPLTENDLGKFFKLVYGYRASVALYTALELGVFDVLAEGPNNAEKVAELCGSALQHTKHLLNACASVGLLEKRENQYLNSPAADNYLVTGKPKSFRNHVAYQRYNFAVWTNLVEAVRENHAVGATVKQLDDPEVVRLTLNGFYEAVTTLGQKIPGYLDLTGRKRMFVSGPASFAAAAVLLEGNPGLHATVLDRPTWLEASKEYFDRHGVTGLVELRPGDFQQDDYGTGYDVNILCQSLQTVNPDKAKNMIQRAYDSLESGGLVGIIGYMRDPSKVAPIRAALWSLHMLSRSDSGEAHTTQDLATWLTEVGFVQPVVHRQPEPFVFSLMVASKP